MKYCTKCGKPLQDGEVCSCQTQNTTEQTAQAAQEQAAQAQAAAQATAGAAQQTAQPQAAKPIITKEQATEISKGMLAYAKEFVKNPVEASEAVVGEHSITTVAGLVVVNAALQLIYSLISIIVHTAKGWHYDIADWVMAIVRPVLWWVAIPAAFAGLIWVCAKYVEGTNVSFKKALSVFAIPALPMLVFTLTCGCHRYYVLSYRYRYCEGASAFKEVHIFDSDYLCRSLLCKLACNKSNFLI